MAATSPALQPVGNKWSGWVISGLFLLVAALVFAAVYLTLTTDQHFWALITIGILSLIFAVGCFLMEAMSRDPSAQRSLAWGFFGMGFAVLLLTIGLGPTYGVLGTVWMLWGLVIVVAVLIVAIALIAWRGRALTATVNQQVSRGAWRNESAPSAFSYAAANSPSVPSTAPPPPASGPSPPPPRAP
jgi:type IV secretory pathway VirB3-like protein